MMTKRATRASRGLSIGASAIALVIALPSAAQEAPLPQDTPPTSTMQPGDEQPVGADIVVTAQKTGAQSVLNVPATITAFDSATLESARVQSLSDVAKLSPSVNLIESFGRGANFLSIRGVSSTETGTPTVQVFVDGFTTGIASGINTTLFDLERVEILEGPQATLYGANAIGGVINYISKKPGNDTRADLRLTYASYNEVTAVGSVSGPVATDKLYAGLSVAYHRRDGYLDDIYSGKDGVDSQEDVSVRGVLRADLGRTTIDLVGTYNYTDDGCGDCSYIPRDYSLVLNPTAPFNTSLRDGLVNVNAYDRTVDSGEPNYLRRRADTEVLTIEHDFGGAVLTSITGHGQVSTDLAFDLSRARSRNPNPVYATFVLNDVDNESTSEELRLAGGHDGGFQWLLGGYYLRIDTNSSTYLGYLLPNPAALDDATTTNYALFANVTLPIGEHLVLGGGLRYDWQKVKDDNPAFGLSGAATSKELLPRATAEYHFDPNLMLYATVSKGYKSGGVNVGTPDPVAPRTYAPEFLWNYEAGLKGKLFDNRLAFSLSAFHIDWTDRQVQLLDTSGLFAYQANLGKAKIDGAELGANLRLGGGLSLDGAVTYLRGRITRYVDASGISTFYGIDTDLSGNRLPNAPRFRASLSPQWTAPLSDTYRLRLRADGSYTGRRFFDAQNLLGQKAYTLVNLYAGVETDRFEIGVFANNVFDKGYHSSGQLTTLGPFMVTGTPRWVGVRTRLKL